MMNWSSNVERVILREPARVVGRATELAELETALRHVRDRQGHAVFLAGEEGIGKSLLTRALAGRARSAGMLVLRGRSSSTGGRVAFRSLMEAMLPLCRDDVRLRGTGNGREVLRRLIPVFTSDGGCSPILLAETLLLTASSAAADRGGLIILEDLHDADDETLAAVEYLADNLEGQPTAFVATLRARPARAMDLVHTLTRRGSGTLVQLDRFTYNEVHTLASVRLGAGPADLPAVLIDRLWRTSAGNPLIADELLADLIGRGLLVPRAGGWQLVGATDTEAPERLRRSIAGKVRALGSEVSDLLHAAATIGERFPLPVVRAMLEVDDAHLSRHMAAATGAGLVAPDTHASDWRVFAHPLTVTVLRGLMSADERVSVVTKAVQVLLDAGERALGEGHADAAADLLAGALPLLADVNDIDQRADVLDAVLRAYADAGRAGHGHELADAVEGLRGRGLAAARLVVLHARLAKVSQLAGRPAEGLEIVARARGLPRAGTGGWLDVMAAELAITTSTGANEGPTAAEFARLALTAAAADDVAEVICRAWLVLGVIARDRDTLASSSRFEQAGAFAARHRMPGLGLRAQVELSREDWLQRGAVAGLRHARSEARHMGVATVVHQVDLTLALHDVLSGRFADAARTIEACRAEVGRPGAADLERELRFVEATFFAHQGGPAVAADPGVPDRFTALDRGLAASFRALLAEDRARARTELVSAAGAEAANPPAVPLTGRHGLRLLLDALDGEITWPEVRDASAADAAKLRWNRQFVLLAKAVLLGHRGARAEATTDVLEAAEVGEPFAPAWHLGLRLVAETAVRDGWGEPASWLRSAEDYFHRSSAPAVANACRSLLRRMGASVPSRGRTDFSIPSPLRSSGVTAREYEVFRLLVDRPGNRAIARQLHISPRTVEKHVAQLLSKTGHRDRVALAAFAANLSADPSLVRPP